MMGTLEILDRVKKHADYWALLVVSYGTWSRDAQKVAESARDDFKRLQNEIEKSLDEQAERMAADSLQEDIERAAFEGECKQA